MRPTSLALALTFGLGLAALAGCTGRTPPASLPRSVGANVVDAGGPTDAGVVDSAVAIELYEGCGQLSDCPAGTIRCTIDRGGVCNPPCNNDGTCPLAGDKAGLCVGDGTVEWCVLPCTEDQDCPAQFVCSGGGTCVRS